MKTLIFALIFTLSIPAFANLNAHGFDTCEPLLMQEFSREPNDLEDGFITDRVALSVRSLAAAYSRGIFPWSVNGNGFGRWFKVPQRGVLDFADLHISRSDRQFIRKSLESGEYQITFDQNFEAVIRACADQRRYRYDRLTGRKRLDGTWITPQIIKAFTQFHNEGHAHSVEVWRNGRLVGGLYGVFVSGVFTGESMFHTESDATKLALYALIERLRANGHTFIDTQMAVGLVQKWGAKLIPREEFEKRLEDSHSKLLSF